MDFGKQVLLEDVGYSAWASRSLLRACSAFPAEDLERDLRISHSNILSTLQHVYDGEWAWLLCLRDTPDSGVYVLPPGPSARQSLDDLKQNWPALWEGCYRWLEGQSEASLNVELTVKLPGAEPHFRRWKILRHMLDHSQFHRGQVVGMIRALGYLPPAINRTDYFFVDESDKRPGASM